MSDRTPPANLQAEESLLGAMMLSTQAVEVAREIVRASDFHMPRNQLVFDAILEATRQLADDAEAAGETPRRADEVIVASILSEGGNLTKVGGPQVLTTIVSGTPATSNAARYARIVNKLACNRAEIVLGNEIAERGYDQLEPLVSLGQAQKCIDDLVRVADLGETVLTPEARSKRYFSLLEERVEGLRVGLSSGIALLDEILGGHRAGEVTVLGGPTGSCKTMVAQQIALNVALAGDDVLMVSLEMDRDELDDRWVSNLARVDSRKIRSPHRIPPSVDEWARINAGADQLHALPLEVLDDPDVTMEKIAAVARLRRSKLIILDYVQLFGTMGIRDRTAAVSAVSREFKLLCRRLGCHGLAISQLSRAHLTRTDPRPVEGDLRESGQIGQDATAIVMVYEDPENPAVTELIVRKNRHGEKDRTVPVIINKAFARVAEPPRSDTYRQPPPPLRLPDESRRYQG